MRMNNDFDQPDEDLRDPATRAFDALRDELVNVRQSVESLNVNIQQSRPYDYRKTLGQILRTQEGVETELQTLKTRPAMQYTPESFSQEMERERERLTAKDKKELRDAIETLRNNCSYLKDLVQSAWDANTQLWMLIATGISGIMVGSIFCIPILTFVAGLAPESMALPESIASDILGLSMPKAGIRLIKKGDPVAWEFIEEANNILRKNINDIKACKKEAVEKKKEVKCSIFIE